MGTTPGALTLAGTANSAAGPVAANPTGTAFLIANDGAAAGTGARPLDALIDRLAIYGSFTDGTGALTLAQLNTDSMYPVPEPTTTALLVASTVGLFGFGYVRRKRAGNGATI